MQTGHLKMGLGCPFDLCGLSWTAPGAFVDCPRLLFGPLWAVPGTSRGLCGRSWAALGPLWAVLGCFWGLSWRSWAAPGHYVGGPWAPPGEKLPFLERGRAGKGSWPDARTHRSFPPRSALSFFSYRYICMRAYMCVRTCAYTNSLHICIACLYGTSQCHMIIAHLYC